MNHRALLLAATLLCAAPPSDAAEVFGGLSAHSLCTEWADCDGAENGRGVDLQFGVRSAPLTRLLGADVLAHGIGSVNTGGATSFAAIGGSLRWNIGRLYIAPGLGIAYNNSLVGARYEAYRLNRRDLGSHVTFEPELTVGARLSDTVAVELAFVHLSHLWIASRHNPGLDMLGGRVAFRF